MVAYSLLLIFALAMAVDAAVRPLPANAKFDYQIGGSYTPASDVRVVTRDRTAAPVAGLYNICYINAFQTQAVDKKFWAGASLTSRAPGRLLTAPQTRRARRSS